jgi:hypothetical protein
MSVLGTPASGPVCQVPRAAQGKDAADASGDSTSLDAGRPSAAAPPQARPEPPPRAAPGQPAAGAGGGDVCVAGNDGEEEEDLSLLSLLRGLEASIGRAAAGAGQPPASAPCRDGAVAGDAHCGSAAPAAPRRAEHSSPSASRHPAPPPPPPAAHPPDVPVLPVLLLSNDNGQVCGGVVRTEADGSAIRWLPLGR